MQRALNEPLLMLRNTFFEWAYCCANVDSLLLFFLNKINTIKLSPVANTHIQLLSFSQVAKQHNCGWLWLEPRYTKRKHGMGDEIKKAGEG